MTIKNLSEELSGCAYPGRGIVAGMSEDGKKAVSAYFILEEARAAVTVYLYRTERVSEQKLLTHQHFWLHQSLLSMPL